ncbi:hypothetical protein KCU65_g194, partial [Aureobasidium melanogenum]
MRIHLPEKSRQMYKNNSNALSTADYLSEHWHQDPALIFTARHFCKKSSMAFESNRSGNTLLRASRPIPLLSELETSQVKWPQS